jgi:hypothetical protein
LTTSRESRPDGADSSLESLPKAFVLKFLEKRIVGSSSRANYLVRNAAMDDSIGGS